MYISHWSLPAQCTVIGWYEEAGRAHRSTSNQSSEPCEVAQYPHMGCLLECNPTSS